MTIGIHEQIAALALANHIPMISEARVWAEAGGVVSYGAQLTPAVKRGAGYIDRILRGAKPQELPIQQPVEFDLVVNLRSAKALGITVPQSIVGRADHVIR
jgi:putative ABC transport system substrate-binding protein